MNSTETPYRRSYSPEHKQRQGSKKKRAKALVFGTIGSLLLLAGACSLRTDMTEGTVNPKLSVMGLQSDVTEVNVRVTGPGYQQNVTVTPSESRLEFFIPPGDDVKFEVEAANQDSATSHVYSWGMTRYADLAEGEETELDFMMGPKDTKILVPDFINGRLVQIDELGGVYQLSSALIPAPEDIAIDNQGKILIANSATTNASEVLRMNAIDTSTPEQSTATEFGNGLYAIAFDSLNSYLYYVHSSNSLGRLKIGPTTIGSPEVFDPVPAAGDGIINSAIEVDHQGNVYYMVLSSPPAIYKYDTTKNTLRTTYSDADFGFGPFDILIKNNHVYVLSGGGTDGKVIVKLTKNLNFVDSFGRIGVNNTPGVFLGPTRFLATTKEGIYVTDDTPDINRIVKFDDVDGSGWEYYQPQIDGVDLLSLFN